MQKRETERTEERGPICAIVEEITNISITIIADTNDSIECVDVDDEPVAVTADCCEGSRDGGRCKINLGVNASARHVPKKYARRDVDVRRSLSAMRAIYKHINGYPKRLASH